MGKIEKAVQGSVRQALRDGFAKAALVGMLSSAPICDRTQINKRKWAGAAYEWADAMMKARKA